MNIVAIEICNPNLQGQVSNMRVVGLYSQSMQISVGFGKRRNI